MVVGAPQEMQQELLMSCPGVSILSYMLVAETRLHTHGVNEADRLRLTASNMVGMVGWATNKRFEISKFKFKFPRARTYELIRARSRLYRSQTLQVNTRWKALAEIYTMHSFAPFSMLKNFVKNR